MSFTPLFELAFENGIILTELLSGSYVSQYGGPKGMQWNVTLADKQRIRETIPIGSKGSLLYKGKPQITGYLEELSSSRGMLTLKGYDLLSPLAECSIDPYFRLKDQMTLRDGIEQILAPFNVGKIELNNVANLRISTGQAQSSPKDAVLSLPQQQCKVDGSETALEILGRLLKRNGYYISSKADGSGVVISNPDYVTTLYSISEKDLLSADYSISISDAPSLIVALGKSSGGKDAVKRLGAYAVNEFTEALQLSEINAYLKNPAYASLPKVASRTIDQSIGIGKAPFKPILLRDDESKTQEQLEIALARKRAEMMHNVFNASLSIRGCEIDGVPVVPNTNLVLVDNYSRFSGRMYIDRVSVSFDAKGIISTLDCKLSGSI